MPARHPRSKTPSAAKHDPITPPAAPAPTRAVTMADVAARVGVSKMTVSRALNRVGSNDRQASEVLRQRILAASRDMGYVIDQTARAFSSQRSRFVAALIPALNNSNFADTAHGLSAAIGGRGLQVLLAYTDYDLPTEERLLRAMLISSDNRAPTALGRAAGDAHRRRGGRGERGRHRAAGQRPGARVSDAGRPDPLAERPLRADGGGAPVLG